MIAYGSKLYVSLFKKGAGEEKEYSVRVLCVNVRGSGGE